MKPIIPYRYWLIEGSGLGDRLRHCAGPPHEPAHGQDPGRCFTPSAFLTWQFEDVQQYDIDGVTVTQRQNAGRITGISWTREGYEYLLYSLQPEMNMIAGLAVEFVTNTRAEAVA